MIHGRYMEGHMDRKEKESEKRGRKGRRKGKEGIN